MRLIIRVSCVPYRYSPYVSELNAYNNIFEQYERVVIQSLISAFGLDFLIRDQHGGDVDTIHNVRLITKDNDELFYYKNKDNKAAYDNRGAYDRGAYHSTGNFRQINQDAKKAWLDSHGVDIKDEYTNSDIGFYGNTKAITTSRKAELDHIISAKEIHEDRGRLLSGLDGKKLADAPENFAWTNQHLNRSMKEENIQDYVKAHPELDKETKERMLARDQQARQSYNDKLNIAYYTSSGFIKDTAFASAKVGVGMGLRQALGLVFSEIWFAVRAELKRGYNGASELFEGIAAGVKKGFANAKDKYREIWDKFIEGAVSGVLASVTTTLCNMFLTTAKNVVRIIRQCWASLVEAVKVIFFNPDYLPFGERFRAAAKIIATGASIVAGTMVSELIATTPINKFPVVGEIVQTFCGTLVSGILSCSLLYLLDTNPVIDKLVKVLNSISTVDDVIASYRLQARLLDEYCAKLMEIDLAKFQEETRAYSSAVAILSNASNDRELNEALQSVCEQLNIKSPFGKHKDIDSFMDDPDSVLVFE